MRRMVFALLGLALVSCSTAKKETGFLAPSCGPTPISIKDVEAFGFTAPKNKVTVMRIFATWCPFCKEDLIEIGGHFRNGDYSAKTVEVLLLSYKNKRESKATYDKFVRETFPKLGIPSEAAQIVYVDQDYNELSKLKSIKGEPMFTGWQGVPYGLVFAKDGRLAYRGHFTNSPGMQDQHYVYIRNLIKETCSEAAK